MTRARAVGAALGAIATCALGVAACGLEATLLRDPSASPDASAGDAAGTDGALPPPFDGATSSDAYGVYAGQYFTCALVAGVGWCWGANTDGELATGDALPHLTPARTAGAIAFASIAPGESHACGLEASTGRVLCWGSGASGQLGQGDTRSHLTPQTVSGIGPAAQVASGYAHTCAVLRDGTLWCWGTNQEGQLGLGTNFNDVDVPTKVGTAADWIYVAGGQGHTCGLRAPWTLWCWGRNTSGELGLGAGQPIQLQVPTQVGSFDDWTQIDLGQDDACGVRKDGSLWCWGDGDAGELVPQSGSNIVVDTPTRIGTRSDWATVDTDIFTTCAVTQAGDLFCWGRNAEGQLGVGDTNDRTAPTATGTGTAWGSVTVGRFHVCAESTTHAVRCTGANESGELGQGDTNRRDTLTDVALPGTH